jgi:predicted transcriptional regulator
MTAPNLDKLAEAQAAADAAQEAATLAAEKVAEALAIVAEPDAAAKRWRQVTLSISPELLNRVDEIAQRKHLSRAALLTEWINDQLEQELSAAKHTLDEAEADARRDVQETDAGLRRGGR